MSIAFDAKSFHPISFQGNFSWNHTPVGSPRGVLVLLVQNVGTSGSTNDEIVSVKYGGVDLIEVSPSPFVHSIGENDAVIHAFFLGENIPSGVRQVVVTVSSPAFSFKRAVAITFTAENDTSVDAADILDAENVDDPSVTLTTSVETAVVGVLLSGHSSVIVVAPGSGFTELLEHDFGSQVASFQRGSSNFSAGSVEIKWQTVGNEDAGIFAVAVREN